MYLKIIILAVIQGITEFLPVSSSGQLAIFGKLLDIQDSETLLITVVLHAGTLLAIIIYYFNVLLSLCLMKNRKIIYLIIIGTIPAVIFGLFLKKSGIADKMFSNLFIPGIGLLITATLLKFGINKKTEGIKEIDQLTFKESLLIGVFQAFAIFPGISRSGSTIIGSLMQKLNRNAAATFCFLLAIPAIGGASFLELLSALKDKTTYQAETYGALILGFLISAIVGYFSLKILLNSLKKGNLNPYAYYCYAAGIIAIAWQCVVMIN
ncbi:MAG TPA: undecaprenyl-diphosphate phosphatase [Victivallales bacterium]|nr:undecaprenyl-diphosphate phosphatase [Victivallales bacterium]